jgi:hypothetical protein
LGDGLDVVEAGVNEVAGQGDEIGGETLDLVDSLSDMGSGDGPAKVEIAQLGNGESIQSWVEIRDADVDLVGFQPEGFDHSGIT